MTRFHNYQNPYEKSAEEIELLNGLVDEILLRTADADKYYEQAIDYNQDNYIIYENLAISYDLSDRTDKAIETYDKVINTFKTNNGRVEFYKGLLLVSLGENELGCSYLKESSNKNYVGSNSKIRASEVFLSLCVNN